ncbi:MAG: sialidase family protein [Acidobacteriota bacterium]
MTAALLAFAGFGFGTPSVPASSAPSIAIGPTVTISSDAPADPHGESFLAINPKNSRNQVATACRIHDGKAGSSAYVTHDGGLTWTRVTPPGSAAKVSGGWDAIAYFDARGNAYYAANDRDGLWITHSTDEGRTWSEATLLQATKGFDRQFMGFDAKGRFGGRIYAGASVASVGLDGKESPALAVAFSDDGAKTFGQPRLISSVGEEHVFAFANMVVAPDGTVILPFTTMTMKLTDFTLFEPMDEAKTRDLRMDFALRIAVSGDGGASYSVSPKIVSYKQSGDRHRFERIQGGPNTVMDLSDGPFRGRMYFVWNDDVGDRTNIKVIHSSDNGKTWSKPATVNDNKEPADHANPTIAVNDKGVVGVVWNDRRSHKNECYDLSFSASSDGGETFLPNVSPKTRPTCSMALGNWTPNAEVSAYPKTEDGVSVEGQGFNVLMIATRFPGGGDTQGLAADADGVFHAAWIDGSSGVMRLATTPFTVPGTASVVARREADVTTQVKLVAEHCAFDFKVNSFGCQMHLENKSPLPVAGPFTVELLNMMVNLKEFKVENADNGRAAEGARWDFAAPGGTLAPGASTAARPFHFRFTGIPEKPDYPFMMFKVVSASKDANLAASPAAGAR